MKMLIAALIGAVVFGFVDAKFLVAEIQKMFVDPGTQSLATTGVAAFLGGLWGWIARGMAGSKSRE
jgi:hypothetical protein